MGINQGIWEEPLTHFEAASGPEHGINVSQNSRRLSKAGETKLHTLDSRQRETHGAEFGGV